VRGRERLCEDVGHDVIDLADEVCPARQHEALGSSEPGSRQQIAVEIPGDVPDAVASPQDWTEVPFPQPADVAERDRRVRSWRRRRRASDDLWDRRPAARGQRVMDQDQRPSRLKQVESQPIAASLGISQALVMCDKTNVASRRVIEASGGRPLDATDQKLRYWVPTARSR
jgi:hypothetical protein